jgi:DivIVA domain-containing protein
MSEEFFHLTPLDVRTQEFVRAVRGYDRAQVDQFKVQVAEALERLGRERLQAEERLKSAQEQLRGYRERERAMNEALVAAQQLRSDSREQAAREAELVLKEARAEAQRVVQQAHQDEVTVRERAEAAARQFTAYLAGFRGLLQRQLAELEVLEGHNRTIVELQAGDLARSRQ